MVIALDSTGRGAASQGDCTTVGHSLALKKDGTLWGWGDNAKGELGSGAIGAGVPVEVKNVSDVADIAAGYDLSVVLKRDGTVWTWGENASGQLGDGSEEGRWVETKNGSGLIRNVSRIPVQVKGIEEVTQIAVGGHNFCLALKKDGTVWAWGWGENGELGTGNRSNSLVPSRVKGLEHVVAVAAGGNHSLALMQDGTVWAWGTGSFGSSQGVLGNDEGHDQSNTPIKVKDIEGAVAVAASEDFSLALSKDGTVWSWGANRQGQLGNGDTQGSNKPGQVKNLTDITWITASALSSFAQAKNGAVWVWGNSRSLPYRLSSMGQRYIEGQSKGR